MYREMSQNRQQQLFVPEPAPLPFEVAAARDQVYAEVVVTRPLNERYFYVVPEGLRELIAPGVRVRVPFGRGNQQIVGYCVGVTHTPPHTSRRLKEISEQLDREPLLTAEMLALTCWMSERYLASWGQVIEMVVPSGVKAQAGTREILCFIPREGVPDDLTELKLPRKQRDVLQVLLREGRPLTGPELAERAGCGTSPIQKLRERQLIVPVRARSKLDLELETPQVREDDLALNADQQRALDRIVNAVSQGDHQTLLLYGVTGSERPKSTFERFGRWSATGDRRSCWCRRSA